MLEIKEQKTVDQWEKLFRDYLLLRRELKDKEEIDSIINKYKIFLEKKERIVYCAFIDKKVYGFISGMPSGEIMEVASFYVLPEGLSENCGFNLIKSLTKKAFKMGIKYFRFTETLPFNKELTFENNLIKNGFTIYSRAQMILDLSSNIQTVSSLPDGYSFEPFSRERIDEIIDVIVAANPNTHCDAKIYPEFLTKETTRKIFGENNFEDYKPEFNPELLFNNEIVGITFVVDPNEEIAFIGEICIHPNHQGKGLGKNLMKKVIQQCKDNGKKQIGLAVTKENVGAYTLYEKLGFKISKEFLSIVKHKIN